MVDRRPGVGERTGGPATVESLEAEVGELKAMVAKLLDAEASGGRGDVHNEQEGYSEHDTSDPD